ncbi:unnamed protein product [Cunninghamella blakesleeana]
MIRGTVDHHYEENKAHITYDGSDVVLIETENKYISIDDDDLDFEKNGTSFNIILNAWKLISKGSDDYITFDEKRLDYNEMKCVEEKESSQLKTPSMRLQYSKVKKNQYKEKLNHSIKQEDETNYVTSDEILCSIIWKTVTRNRKLDKNTTTVLARAINTRYILASIISNCTFDNFATTYGTYLSLDDVFSLDDL